MKKPRIEGSTENLVHGKVRNIKGIKGLKDIPVSIIPIPFYTLVQPESSKAFLPSGQRAENGTFLMTDIRHVARKLDFLILRAKRQVRFIDGKQTVSLNVLAYDLFRSKTFILSVPVTSFSEFGRFFDELQDLGAKSVWEYPIEATTKEVVDIKDTDEGKKEVTWYIIQLKIAGPKTDRQLMRTASKLYLDFGKKLDNDDDSIIS